jgi:hypothetical protein
VPVGGGRLEALVLPIGHLEEQQQAIGEHPKNTCSHSLTRIGPDGGLPIRGFLLRREERAPLSAARSAHASRSTRGPGAITGCTYFVYRLVCADTEESK